MENTNEVNFNCESYIDELGNIQEFKEYLKQSDDNIILCIKYHNGNTICYYENRSIISGLISNFNPTNKQKWFPTYDKIVRFESSDVYVSDNLIFPNSHYFNLRDLIDKNEYNFYEIEIGATYHLAFSTGTPNYVGFYIEKVSALKYLNFKIRN
jgi:hypothetical protein